MVKINVLMLTYNSEDWLPQVLPPLKDSRVHLIIVDGSKDDSLEIVKYHFPNADIISSDSNNLAYLRNQALRLSEKYPAEYTAFIDSDMVVPEGFFNRAIDILERHKENGGVCIAGTLQFNGKTYTAKFWRNFAEPHSLVEKPYLCTGSTMFKTEALKGIEIDERCKRSDEDVDLCMQIGRRGYKLLCDYTPPYTVHIRDATLKAELSRYIQFGKHVPLMRLKYGSKKTVLRTILTDYFTIGSIILLFLTPFFGFWCLLPTIALFGRHWLKIKRKWRIDHVLFSMLLSYVYNGLCGIYLVRHWLANLRRRHRQ